MHVITIAQYEAHLMRPYYSVHVFLHCVYKVVQLEVVALKVFVTLTYHSVGVLFLFVVF